MNIPTLFLVPLVMAAACGSGTSNPTGVPTTTGESNAVPPTASTALAGPAAPVDVPSGPLDNAVLTDVETVFQNLGSGVDREAIGRIGASPDVRVAWLMSDLLRFLGAGEDRDSVIGAFSALTGVRVSAFNPWVESTNLLLGWDLAAPPGYRELKGMLFTTVDGRWAPFFDDPDSEIDYRWLNWGGVRPDDRPLGDFEATCRGGCIPALDDPAVTDVAGGSWYPDDAIIFGVSLGGESRAYPKNMMEIHEMVIDTVGGVRLGMPYCTLCGSAQAYDLESVPAGVESPVLRTSGLLSRSNKVMYDLNTWSAFDTFTGRAVSGPLREAGVTLDQLTVITATWGDWKAAHPDTTIIAQDGGIGREYPSDPLRGRDDDGPIFPVGPVDSRLPVQEQILGVATPSGTFIAFPVTAAQEVIARGGSVEQAGIRVLAEAGGLTAEGTDGTPVASHQSFWFAWSQFHPQTDVWLDSGL